MQDRLEKAQTTLKAVDQLHVLRFWDELDESQREQLLAQVESIDWEEVARLVKTHVLVRPQTSTPENLAPAPWYPISPDKGQKDKYRKARQHGEQLLRQGKVAAFTVAGGQGSRLGFDGPKGSYPATPIRQVPLFCLLAQYIRKAEQKYECTIPWYIMTSTENDAATHDFFDEHGYFGLQPTNVMMFSQAMLPAIDASTNPGKVLLSAKDSMALAPNGHGGSLKALHTSGAIEDMKQRGVEQISYTQIDNPTAKVVDPLFIGLHAQDNCEMSSKMVAKAYPKEKLGNFCLADDKITIIEYSNLPDELAEQRDENGELRFQAGSIAIHMIQVDFVEQLNTRPGGFALPFNRADKKVAHIDLESGEPIEPDTPNAVKMETFVFDALPLCEQSIILQTDRIEEFAPIKNADAPDAVDSPATSKQLQTERAARWLEANGVKIARNDEGNVDAVIEISPLTAIEPADLKKLDLPQAIDSGTEVLL